MGVPQNQSTRRTPATHNRKQYLEECGRDIEVVRSVLELHVYSNRGKNQMVLFGVNPKGDATEQQNSSCPVFKSTHTSVRHK